MKPLFQIAAELRLVSGELRGHDLDQWLWLERLADELEEGRREIMTRSNRLARRALPFSFEDELAGWWLA